MKKADNYRRSIEINLGCKYGSLNIYRTSMKFIVDLAIVQLIKIEDVMQDIKGSDNNFKI